MKDINCSPRSDPWIDSAADQIHRSLQSQKILSKYDRLGLPLSWSFGQPQRRRRPHTNRPYRKPVMQTGMAESWHARPHSDPTVDSDGLAGNWNWSDPSCVHALRFAPIYIVYRWHLILYMLLISNLNTRRYSVWLGVVGSSCTQRVAFYYFKRSQELCLDPACIEKNVNNSYIDRTRSAAAASLHVNSSSMDWVFFQPPYSDGLSLGNRVILAQQ